jgi:hypothetical protein
VTSCVCDELGLSVLAATSCSCVVSTKGELAGLMDGGATGEDDGVQGGGQVEISEERRATTQKTIRRNNPQKDQEKKIKRFKLF